MHFLEEALMSPDNQAKSLRTCFFFSFLDREVLHCHAQLTHYGATNGSFFVLWTRNTHILYKITQSNHIQTFLKLPRCFKIHHTTNNASAPCELGHSTSNKNYPRLMKFFFILVKRVLIHFASCGTNTVTCL